MKINVLFAPLFLYSLALITHDATKSVNPSISTVRPTASANASRKRSRPCQKRSSDLEYLKTPDFRFVLKEYSLKTDEAFQSDNNHVGEFQIKASREAGLKHRSRVIVLPIL